MMKNGRERELGMECGRAESGKPPTQGLPAVDGSVLKSVPVRRTQDQTRCLGSGGPCRGGVAPRSKASAIGEIVEC